MPKFKQIYMKKVFACLVMAGFLLASCGGSEETKTDAPEATEATEAPAADTTAAPADTTATAPAAH